jgi:DNA polymerase delta subunit 1
MHVWFQDNVMSPFIKVTVAIPKLIAPSKRLLEGNEIQFTEFSTGNSPWCSFETNIDFEIRFMADTKMVGCSWIELPVLKHTIRKTRGRHC